MGSYKLLVFFARLLLLLGLETFEVTSAHILRGTLDVVLDCLPLCRNLSLEGVHRGDRPREVVDRSNLT